MEKVGGYKKIYQDLVDALKSINLAANAKSLNLACNQSDQVEIVFLGRTYLLGTDGVHTNEIMITRHNILYMHQSLIFR